jgi:hypothetical protein
MKTHHLRATVLFSRAFLAKGGTMTGSTGAVRGTGSTSANGADRSACLRSGEAEIKGFNLALSGAAQVEAGKVRGSVKTKAEGDKDRGDGKQEAVADDSKRSMLADESVRPPDGGNVVPPDVLRSILCRPAEQQLRQALPSPQGQTRTGQPGAAQQMPSSPGTGAPQKSQKIEVDLRGAASVSETNDASSPYTGPRRDTNEASDVGAAASGKAAVAWNITPKFTASAFASGELNTFLDQSDANGCAWAAGARVDVKMGKVQLGGEYQRQHTYDAAGTPFFTANVVNATVKQPIASSATTFTPSAAFEYRDADAPGFSRSRFTTAVDIRRPLNKDIALVGSGRLSAFHFVDGGNAGRTDVISTIVVGAEYKGATFALEYAKRTSTQSGRDYDNVKASVTFNVGHKFLFW